MPFPDQEKNAVDVVMQFAIHRLNFLPESIIVYAWSIGAFCATWAAMNYPDIRGLVSWPLFSPDQKGQSVQRLGAAVNERQV